VIYKREDILTIWRGLYGFASFPENSPIPFMSSSDYRWEVYNCPNCAKKVSMLVRISGAWKCPECTDVSIGIGRGKTAAMYRITNDLIEFFGEKIPSEKLFSPVLMKSFVKFTKVDKSGGAYVMFLAFLRAVLAKEVGAFSILGYLSEADKKTVGLPNKEYDMRDEGVNELKAETAEAK